MKMVNCFNTTTAIEHLGQNKQQMEIRPICNHKGSAVWLRKKYDYILIRTKFIAFNRCQFQSCLVSKSVSKF